MQIHKYHTIVLGSGAAGLNAALRLRAEGVRNIAIVTEGLQLGTSINTGSDKQTYYKLGVCGADADSPYSLAQSLQGSSAHGDIALVEAANSMRAFMNLVNLGVPFPRDAYGQFAGYKTDHDPLRRATSCGPYTSREMCRALIREIQDKAIPVFEDRVAVRLVKVDNRAAGLIAVHLKSQTDDSLEYFQAENVVFAVGGPGGLYESSVYPAVHTGAIGLALQIGAQAASLPESQFGLASIKFRWNVSGTYMQVIPRFISTNPDGSDEREFLRPYFQDAGTMNSMVFLKGYQWPFDSRKIPSGSSLIDIFVYEETAVRNRRVFLDFRSNPTDFQFEGLSAEAQNYLKNSNATGGTPIDRLKIMNPAAIRLYQEHGIDLFTEPLEIAVCAQHNNGGLAGTIWYESTNIPHLFPIGEVNGSHGVTRPGGSALNAGQVGAFRAAEFIARRYAGETLDAEKALAEAERLAGEIQRKISTPAPRHWREERREFQHRMTLSGGHIRNAETIDAAIAEGEAQLSRLNASGVGGENLRQTAEGLRNLQLCFAHVIYLKAIAAQLKSGTGSRGSSLVLNPQGQPIHPMLSEMWHFIPENESFRTKQLVTTPTGENAEADSAWIPCRPIPQSEDWFETVWAEFATDKYYKMKTMEDESK